MGKMIGSIAAVCLLSGVFAQQPGQLSRPAPEQQKIRRWCGEAAPCKASVGCTTIIIGRKATADGSVLMAHNEDYGDNDCMHLVYHPRETHKPGEVIRFAYASVPQVPLTHAYTAVEMYSGERLGMPPAKFLDGMNEFGLSLASNCIDSRELSQPNSRGLGWPEIGQLVMQRCKAAREAVDLCARLVEQYTFNGFENTDCKNLTFLMADANEGWIMEVTRGHWAAKRCTDDGGIFYANQAQIGTDYDLASPDLVSYAVANHWYDPASGKKLNFREAYGDKLGDPVNTLREARARELLSARMGRATPQDLMRVMKDHFEGRAQYSFPHSRQPRTICAGWTQSSQVYHLRGALPRELGCMMWSLAGSPCLGTYTPIWAGYGGGVPGEWQTGTDSFSPDSAWWTFEAIQRSVAPYDDSGRTFREREMPLIQNKWSSIETREAGELSTVETKALRLLKEGSKENACRLLTDFTNTQLHSVFLEARAVLERLTASKGRTGGEL